MGKRGAKYVSNIHNYDILQNRTYADKFFYQTMERRIEHESSDMIAQLIYMGENSLEKTDVPVISMNTIEKLKNKPLKRTIT